MRYFIVMFNGNNNDGASLSGMATSVVNGDGYVNQSLFQKDACEKQNLKTIVIKNIIELNESDYKDFIRE